MKIGIHSIEDAIGISFFILLLAKIICELWIMIWIVFRVCREARDKYIDLIKMIQHTILFIIFLNDVSINMSAIWIELDNTFLITVGNVLVPLVLYIPLSQLSWLVMIRHMNANRLSLSKREYKDILKELKSFEIRSFAWMILFFVLFISLIAVSFYLISQEGNKTQMEK